MKYDYKYLDKFPTQPFDLRRYLVIHTYLITEGCCNEAVASEIHIGVLVSRTAQRFRCKLHSWIS